MISLHKLFGKDDDFFDLLEASAGEARASALALNRLLKGEPAKQVAEDLGASRRKDKQITREIGERLVKAMVTALEREDIESLSSALYKITKSMEKFAERFQLAGKLVQGSDFFRLGEMLDQATDRVQKIVGLLRHGARLQEVKDLNDQLQQLEGDADKLMLDLLRDLYSGRHDPLHIMARRDLHELLERAMDRCRDAGKTVSYIVLKHA
jgi:uncharacterized protein Yka (UPF0111/DUF47 family)